MNYEELKARLRADDRPSFLAALALEKRKGDVVVRHREDILRFLQCTYGDIPIDRYLARLAKLRVLQEEFDKVTHRHRAHCYADVPAIDRDEYNVALLLSFILTHHRFEILESLESFLSAPTEAPQKLLCVGFGTGYELKVAQTSSIAWEYEAYDSAPESRAYASQLLAFFGLSTAGLRSELFPLEVATLPAEYRGKFGKIVLCELLEHLERPGLALHNAAKALHPAGSIFATMAINIAQEDHVFLYRSLDQARQQVADAGLRVCRELLTPATILPFAERDREKIFTKGNYVCVLAKP